MTNQPSVRFQHLSPTDAPGLSEVARRAYADHYLDLWYDAGAWYMNRSFAPDVLRRELEDTNARFYLLLAGDEPIGFLKLNLDRPSPCNPSLKALELERIYLVKQATGQGVGKTAMQFVDEQARQLGRQLIWLKAMDSSHDALTFYEKMGFERCGTDRLNFAVMKEAYWGMVILQRPL